MQTMRTMYGEKSEFIEDIFKAETDIDVSVTDESHKTRIHIFPDPRMKLRRARDKGGVRVPAPHQTSGAGRMGWLG